MFAETIKYVQKWRMFVPTRSCGAADRKVGLHQRKRFSQYQNEATRLKISPSTTSDADTDQTPEAECYRVVSLFAGCGGADLGFQGGFSYLSKTYEALPFVVSWANDVDRFAAQVYRDNLADVISNTDIAGIRFETLQLPPTDVLVAGFPCQEFAMLGPRGGLKSERGQLYKEVRRALKSLRPKLFLVENVPGIEHPKSTLRTIIRCLAGRGAPRYKVQVFRINAADYGVPQHRKRIIVVGTRADLHAEFEPPAATRVNPKEADRLEEADPWLTAIDALDDLWCAQGPTASAVPDQSKVTQAAIVLDKPKRRDKRIEANEPSPTIRAEHHGHVELHYRLQDDGSPRHLTVRECARLQGFPDSFIFPVSFTQGYRQIGNATPPVLIHSWARSIQRWLIDGDASEAAREQSPAPRDARITSKIMSAVKNRGSKAELTLARAMWRAGLRYRKHPRGMPGNPDYAFPGVRLAVFCDGDFWHGRGWQSRGFKSWDEQFDRLARSEFWRLKIRRNMQRDEEVDKKLRSLGWMVLRITESEIQKNPDKCAETVRLTIEDRRGASLRSRHLSGSDTDRPTPAEVAV